jgi:hypothetical protein
VRFNVDMNRAILTILALYAVSNAVAFDYDPPPRVKTMEWTIKIANATGTWIYEDETAESILADLDRSMSLPGAYLDIDRSQVRQKLETKLTFHAEKFTWLQLLAKVADAIGADVMIAPGKFTLIPRSK